PLMSQIVMSILSSPGPSGDEEVSSFLETFVPSVWMYLSSKFSSTNRRMREVLPTAASPTRQTFTFIRLTSMKNRPATWHSLRSPLKSYGSVITDDTSEPYARRWVFVRQAWGEGFCIFDVMSSTKARQCATNTTTRA